jgi:hypothetical protein
MAATMVMTSGVEADQRGAKYRHGRIRASVIIEKAAPVLPEDQEQGTMRDSELVSMSI